MHHTMTTPSAKRGLRLLGIAAGAVLAFSAHAQGTSTTTSTSTGADMSRSSWIPATSNGYIGLNVGRSNFGNSCGTLALRCDDSDTMAKLTLGGYFNPNFGAEFGYTDMGDMDRSGGRTSARALSFALIGRAPLSNSFSVYGKLGANYGRTRVSAVPGSGVATGRDSGWGPTYALGLSWDMTRNWSAVLEFERARYHFAGGRDYVGATSLGLRYNF